jgi:flagellar motor switch protein FliN/FliY
MMQPEQFDHYLDMPLSVEAVLDEKTMTIFEILALEEGSVIKLNRSAGENIDLIIGGRSSDRFGHRQLRKTTRCGIW